VLKVLFDDVAGEGIPDLLMLLVQLTQSRMASKLAYIDKLQCTVLEVRSLRAVRNDRA
jgi:translation initiation factor 5B